MLVQPDGPASAPRPGSSGPVIETGPHLIDLVIFLAFLVLCLTLLDLVTGWALTGFLQIGRIGMPVLWVAFGVPLAAVGVLLGRTAITGYRERSRDPGA